MQFKTFLKDFGGALQFSWYRAAVTDGGAADPVFRFTVINPAWAATPPYSAVQSYKGRVEFVWVPG